MARAPAKRKVLAKRAVPTIALALGAGGARGLAHIVVLETLDELGLKPVAISGTSMGAVIGAAYAAGVSGAELRAHVLAMAREKARTLARLMKARVGRFSDFFARLDANPVLVDAETLLDLFWPQCVPDRFEDLKIPFSAIATDYHGRRVALFENGPLAPAVAGSMAIPGLVKPVEADGLVLVDGGLVDPLPYRALAGKADIVIASDVSGSAAANGKRPSGPYETIIGSAQIVQCALTSEMLKVDRPEILLRPRVGEYRALDFFRAANILESAASLREDIRAGLEKCLERA